MARINVEETWFADLSGRRAALINAVANAPRNVIHEADGMATNAWRLAQEYWRGGKDIVPQSLVPEEVWRRRGFEPMIDAGLAERRPDGIYVKGAKEHHDWLVKKSAAGRKGGVKSAEKRWGVKTEEKCKQTLQECKQTLPIPEAKSNPHYSLLSSLKKEKKRGGVSVSDFDTQLAHEWAALAKEKSDTLNPNLGKYADAIRRLQSSVGLTEAQVRETFNWIKASDFWRNVALSPAALFKSKEEGGPRKIDNIRAQMAKSGPTRGRQITPILEPGEDPHGAA